MLDVTFDGTIFGLQRVGGVSTYAWEMVRRLAAAPDIGLTLTLPRRMIASRTPAILALDVAQRRSGVSTRFSRYLPATRANGDVYHSPYYRAPLAGRARRIVTVHDFVYERYRTGLARQVHALQKRRAVERADAVLCVSTNTADDLRQAYPSVDPAKVFVTPLAVDQLTFFPAGDRRTDLGDGIVFVGQRRGYKRFDLAVAAVAATGLRLVVVGDAVDDTERAHLDRTLPGRWQALGRIDDAALRRVYSGAFALIAPSDYEGFGLPLLEAQACGCPVVVANRSSFPEVGGSAAHYVAEQRAEAYAAALAALGDSATRAATVAAGIANATAFDWDRTYAATIAAYTAGRP